MKITLYLSRPASCLFVSLLLCGSSKAEKTAAPDNPSLLSQASQFTAIEHRREVIYHSPQTPGFTSWVGTWPMPDGSIMVTFTQATGPAEGRPLAPEAIQRLLDWPPPGLPTGYDMTGLDLRNVHLRSTDLGRSWKTVSADAFKSNMNGITGEAEVALADGTVVRGVWGNYLPYNPELPQTGYLQRSHDGTLTWGPPEVFLDAKKFMTYPKRLRLLRDGRLVLFGGVAPVPANSLHREAMAKYIDPLLMVSADGGRTWQGPIPVVPPKNQGKWGGEEYDAAELPNGDLLCVFRRPNPALNGHETEWVVRAGDTPPDKTSPEVRMQSVLKKTGDSWTPGEVRLAPFPHSGHPELLVTREGPVLHFATSGIYWTLDAGATWHRLDIPGSAYYPHALQAADGRILVFGHIGGDDAYGKGDQSIVMDSFRLVKQ
ncbi:MAG: sialidase family protein [Lacunisphaera sp.]|nr:sialidase family protein [Lacunisphaera sp.]